MTWDPLGLEMLREVWVDTPDVVASEEVIEETILPHLVHTESVHVT